MHILVVNDDGIRFKGIEELVRLAREYGEVTVVAPDSQCSAMSQKITISGQLQVKKEEFPIEGVAAYSVEGTPADCVKVALECLMDEKPDLIFSGINEGYNIAYDIVYSGTVGAAMEGIMHGVKSIAYSLKSQASYDVVRAYFKEVTDLILKRDISIHEIWNVNFPGCSPEEVQGILFDRQPAPSTFYGETLHLEMGEDGRGTAKMSFRFNEKTPEGTDMEAVNKNYISIGKVRNLIPSASF